jgi:hypothetical protein
VQTLQDEPLEYSVQQLGLRPQPYTMFAVNGLQNGTKEKYISQTRHRVIESRQRVTHFGETGVVVLKSNRLFACSEIVRSGAAAA